MSWRSAVAFSVVFEAPVLSILATVRGWKLLRVKATDVDRRRASSMLAKAGGLERREKGEVEWSDQT